MWVTSQIGSREHYAVPKALNRIGSLQKFYTDIWVSPSYTYLSLLGSNGKALLNRFDAELIDKGESLGNINSVFQQKFRRSGGLYNFYCHQGKNFAERINKKLIKELESFKYYFTYNTGALESFKFLKEEGKVLVLGQIDPGRIERDIVRKENEKFPGWATDQYHKAPDYYFERIQNEWELADYVVVNSAWSKRSLIQQGVLEEKIKIVPLSYEAPSVIHIRRAVNQEQIKVLFAANVILRKGIQYLIESAKELQGYNIQFIVAGPINISQHAIQSATSNVLFLGKIERSELYMQYIKSDIFVLPTISDGFAITQIEAMSYGLPVIATNRCGEVVTNGVDGIIISPGNSNELSEAILKYYNNRDFLFESSLKASQKAKLFKLDNLSFALSKIVDEETK